MTKCVFEIDEHSMKKLVQLEEEKLSVRTVAKQCYSLCSTHMKARYERNYVNYSAPEQKLGLIPFDTMFSCDINIYYNAFDLFNSPFLRVCHIVIYLPKALKTHQYLQVAKRLQVCKKQNCKNKIE